MSETKMTKGSCLCGSVKIVARELNPQLGACHCDT